MNYLRLPKLLMFLLFSCFALRGVAQEITITGKVLDKETGKPLNGVSINFKSAKNSNLGSVSNLQGDFSIKVPSAESALLFSYVGYITYERKAGTGTSLVVSLTKSDAQLDEVVVIGYGTKKRVNVLGSVATVKSAEIEDLPVANLASSLVNRVAGVGIGFSSGKPGSTTTISIRNPYTFSGASASGVGVTSAPLYVIDGITVTLEDFENLDASLIEDITFLKDAAAAIFGASGSKGVVLVTTKKGKVGKPKITYSGYFGSSDAAVKPKLMTAYQHAKMLNDGYELNNTALTGRFSQADLDFLKTKPYKSWDEELWSPSSLTRHTVNISGGTEKITFFAGANYYRETGNYGDIGVNKYGFRSGMNAKIIDGLTANVTFSSDFNREERHTLKGASDETDDLSLRALFLTPQWVPLTVQGKPVNWSGPNPPGAWNPSALGQSGNYKWNNSQGLSVNAALEYKPAFIEGLTMRVQFGKLNRNATSKEYFPPYKVYNVVRKGQNGLLYSDSINANSPTSNISNSDQLGESSTISGSYQLIGTISYSKKFRLSDFDIMAGFDQGEGNSENVFYYKNGQLVGGVDEFWAFNNNGQTIRNPTYTESAKRSFLGRMNYTLMNKYMLEVIARYDASANFPPATRWGLFPSVGLGWKISDEDFFRENIRVVNYMKIRANYGLVGEDRVAARLWEARYTQTTGMLFGSVVTNGLDPSIFPNPNITWEKSRTLNVGVDMNLLNNKLSFTADFYNRYTYDGFDKLENGALPASAGINTAVVNYGRQSSWGSEFSLGYKTKLKKDWGFSADVNFGFSNSQLLQAYYNTSYLGIYGTNQLSLMVGRDPKQYNSNNYGYISKGIIRTQDAVDAILAKNPNYTIGGAKPQIGFLDYEDINGDGKIDDNDITVMFDKTTADVAFGITLGVTYKSFKLQTNLNFRVGGKVFYDSEARKVPTTTQNAPAFWDDHWTVDNPNAKFPRADAPLAKENSSFWAVNGTQSRINNMVLSYSVPKKIIERYRIPECRAFLTGTNLFNLINPLKYKDPYTSNLAYYPTLRSISLGLNLSL